MKPYDPRSKKILITVLCLVLGNALLAFLVEAFIIPHDIIMGGTTGIGIVLNKLWPALDVSVYVFIMNMILLFLGLLVLGKKFFVTTIASSGLYPAMIGVFENIPKIHNLTDDPLLAAVFAGCLMGVALGVVMRVGSSTGGMDVLNLMMNKWTHQPVALFVWLTDIIVVGGQALFSSSESILLGILVLVLESIILDKAMILGKSQIQIFVISEQYEKIRKAILRDLEAGVTMTMIETGNLRKEGKGVLCVIPNRKLYQATELIHSIDPGAFVTISQVNEVRGRGFTTERKVVRPEGDAD